MKAIILAAGRGSRMGALTHASPKCLVKLAGKPLLNYQLAALNKAGIDQIAVVCGYAKEKIQDLRIKNKFENKNWNKTNMVRSLLTATTWLEHDSCIISYSDIFYQSSAVIALGQCQADIAIIYYRHFRELWSARFTDPLTDLETFRIDHTGALLEIGNRTLSIAEIEGQYMGLLKFTPTGWSQINTALRSFDPATLDKLDMTSLLSHLLRLKIPIQTVSYDGIWGEVDHVSDLSLYETWDLGALES